MSEPQHHQVATVSLTFIDGEGTCPEDLTVRAIQVNWLTDDMTVARTLRGQLEGLLGDPVSESILDDAPHEAVQAMRNPWPGGVVNVEREK